MGTEKETTVESKGSDLDKLEFCMTELNKRLYLTRERVEKLNENLVLATEKPIWEDEPEVSSHNRINELANQVRRCDKTIEGIHHLLNLLEEILGKGN